TQYRSLDCRNYHLPCGKGDIRHGATQITERMAAGAPQDDGTTMIEPRMELQHVSEAVLYMASLPLGANVQFMTVMATKGLPQNKVYHSTLSVAARRDRIVPLWVLVVGSDV